MIVFLNDRFLLREEAAVSPEDRGFLFADGVYEVIASYRGVPFHLEKHLARLKRSLAELRMDTGVVSRVRDLIPQLLEKNGFEGRDSAVYIQITRGAAPRTHFFPENTPQTVYAFASPLTRHDERHEHGVGVILLPDERWGRCDIKSLSLLPNVLASQQAKEKNAEEALLVRDEVITEGSRTSFCAVFNGAVHTHPLDRHILPGVTRSVLMDLCKRLHIPVTEKAVRKDAVPHADEAMLLSTTIQVVPVTRIDGIPIGDGTPGPVTRSLQSAFRDLSKCSE